MKILHYGLKLQDEELAVLDERRKLVILEASRIKAPYLYTYLPQAFYTVKRTSDDTRLIGRFQTYIPE